MKQLATPPIALIYFLCTSGDETTLAEGRYGVEVILIDKTDRGGPHLEPEDSQSHLSFERTAVERSLFVISTFVSTEGSIDMQKDGFYKELAILVRRRKNTGVVAPTGDFNARNGKLSASEACLRGRCGSLAHCRDNRDRLR